MRFVYPAQLRRTGADEIVVSFRDLPECLTSGVDEVDALAEAADRLRDRSSRRHNEGRASCGAAGTIVGKQKQYSRTRPAGAADRRGAVQRASVTLRATELRQRQFAAEGGKREDAGGGVLVAEVGRAQVHLVPARDAAAFPHVAARR